MGCLPEPTLSRVANYIRVVVDMTARTLITGHSAIQDTSALLLTHGVEPTSRTVSPTRSDTKRAGTLSDLHIVNIRRAVLTLDVEVDIVTTGRCVHRGASNTSTRCRGNPGTSGTQANSGKDTDNKKNKNLTQDITFR